MSQLLKGIRVLDLTRVISGPYCAMVLGDLGADVIKIEQPDGGDPSRQLGPPFKDGESGYFMSINRNKKSLTLNLKDEKGLKIFHDLVKVSDVVLENYRAGVADKLKIGYSDLKKINPNLIYCSITAFGSNGPYKDIPGYDLTMQAISGEISITGEPDGTLAKMGVPMGDLGGSFFGIAGILAALYAREKDGKGRHIDIGLFDTQLAMLCYHQSPYFIEGRRDKKPEGTAHPNIVPYKMYQTKDIKIVVAILGENFWVKLCGLLGIPEIAKDPRFDRNEKRAKNRAELEPVLQQAFLKKSGREIVKLFYAEGIPGAPVNSIAEALEEPQVEARNMIVTVKHPKCGDVKVIGSPIKIEGVKEQYSPPPMLGEHNENILHEVLHYPEAKIKKLKDEGVI
ncbi:MAG: CoA transferase [Candidatus Schekmanbacteria bacterium]|nr:CoA transferase [Candidatus Schekmanbacteria bacterium]